MSIINTKYQLSQSQQHTSCTSNYNNTQIVKVIAVLIGNYHHVTMLVITTTTCKVIATQHYLLDSQLYFF